MVTDCSHFSTEHIFLADDLDGGSEGKGLQVIDKELSALNIKEEGSDNEGFVKRGTTSEMLVGLSFGRILLLHCWILINIIIFKLT